MIHNRSAGVQQTIQRLTDESKNAQDFIAPIGVELQRSGASPIITFAADRQLTMQMPQGEFSLHPHAIGQLADRMGVPAKYLRELSGGCRWQRNLAAEILNEHSNGTERSRVLIRSVGCQVRGILSDSYKRLDSQQILMAFMKIALSKGAVACDALMTDTKVYLETILPEPISIPTRMNGTVMIYMGARFSTSDYGDGALDMRAFLLNGVCLNGMVRESMTKQVHLGAKLPNDLRLSERTYQLDNQTTISAIEDMTAKLYSAENIEQKALEIRAASEMEVDFETELKNLMKVNKLLKDEGEGVRKLLMNNNPEDGLQGGPSLFKLTQALTAYGRDLDPQRSREFSELAGDMMARVNRKLLRADSQ